MVKVGGRAIIDRLIDALPRLGIDELLVVTGFRGDALAAHLGPRRGPIAIRCIDNPDYANSNNIVSLAVAESAIRAPFLLLESDICVDTGVLAGLVKPDRMVVARYTDAMDGTGVKLGRSGRVEEMILRAHLAAPERLGELHKTVNFYSFSRETWDAHYRPRLARWIAAGRVGEYYEAPLAELVNAAEVALEGVDVTGQRWAELDNLDDLRRAEALFP
jgi:choline kinase